MSRQPARAVRFVGEVETVEEPFDPARVTDTLFIVRAGGPERGLTAAGAARLRELWLAGVTSEAIAAEIGMARRTVPKKARELGLPPRRKVSGRPPKYGAPVGPPALPKNTGRDVPPQRPSLAPIATDRQYAVPAAAGWWSPSEIVCLIEVMETERVQTMAAIALKRPLHEVRAMWTAVCRGNE